MSAILSRFLTVELSVWSSESGFPNVKSKFPESIDIIYPYENTLSSSVLNPY